MILKSLKLQESVLNINDEIKKNLSLSGIIEKHDECAKCGHGRLLTTSFTTAFQTGQSIDNFISEVEGLLVWLHALRGGDIKEAIMDKDEAVLSDSGGLEEQVIPDDPKEIERKETIKILRELCDDFGDNDWEDDLHLADIIDKHLGNHIHKLAIHNSRFIKEMGSKHESNKTL